MKPLLLALALSTLCSGCATRVAVPLKPPADRLDCVEIAGRPTIPAEYVVDWAKVRGGGDAAVAEVTRLTASVREREGVAAVYIVQLEDRIFMCASDDEWLRDFYRPAAGSITGVQGRYTAD